MLSRQTASIGPSWLHCGPRPGAASSRAPSRRYGCGISAPHNSRRLLTCVNGWPSTAAILLLRRLRVAGCSLLDHGDLDREGIRLAAYIIAKTGATPWRMSTVDYLGAVPPGGSSAGRITDAPWDPDLAPAMGPHRLAVSEERVLDLLLDDLTRA